MKDLVDLHVEVQLAIKNITVILIWQCVKKLMIIIVVVALNF